MSQFPYKALTFDVYGTLIDWETGMLAELRPWIIQNGTSIADSALLARFGELEYRWEMQHPTLRYSQLLVEVHRELGRSFGIAPDAKVSEAFGKSVHKWPPFPDTVAALHALKKHFRLFVLSNVDHDSFQGTLKHLQTDFDGIYIAEDIGSYKPSQRNFEFAIEKLEAEGIQKSEVLHVAQSLFHDHEPASHLGLANCWIDRRAGNKSMGAVIAPVAMLPVKYTFQTLSEFAIAVEADLASASN